MILPLDSMAGQQTVKQFLGLDSTNWSMSTKVPGFGQSKKKEKNEKGRKKVKERERERERVRERKKERGRETEIVKERGRERKRKK